MIEIKENLWDLHRKGEWICITTNGTINAKGECVMGRGVALEAKTYFPHLPRMIAKYVQWWGNHVVDFPEYRLFTFPVKHHWREKADPALIARSCEELVTSLDHHLDYATTIQRIYIPRPGCGNGRLDWETEVKPILQEWFPGNKYIVTSL